MMRRVALLAHYVTARWARQLRDPEGAPLWIRTDDYVGADVFILGRYETAEIGALRQVVGDSLHDRCLVDVGANIGNHVVALQDLFGQAIAVEPNPEVHAALELNLMSNKVENVVAVPCGFGDRDMVVPFEVEDGNLGGSGFVAGATREGRPASDVQELQVRVGDDVVDEHLDAGRAVGLIKVDVEGLEPEVMSGLAKTIARDQPIVAFEFNGERSDDWFSSHPSLAGYRFAEFGYSGRFEPLDRVRNRTAIKALDITVGHRKRAIVAVDPADGRHHPMILALPPDHVL